MNPRSFLAGGKTSVKLTGRPAEKGGIDRVFSLVVRRGRASLKTTMRFQTDLTREEVGRLIEILTFALGCVRCQGPLDSEGHRLCVICRASDKVGRASTSPDGKG